MEVYYEHPTGYRPNAKELAQRGTAIWDMKKATASAPPTGGLLRSLALLSPHPAQAASLSMICGPGSLET